MGWGVIVTPRPLFTPGKDPVPIVQEAGWAPGPVWTGAENLAPTGIRSPDRPARSQSLYRLSYPAHFSDVRRIFFSREWKHFETIVAEEYCWAMRPIRFLGVGDGISVWLASLCRHSLPYMNTQFRLALVLLERNCCLSQGVSVACLFIQNLSPAPRVWFYACQLNKRL